MCFRKAHKETASIANNKKVMLPLELFSEIQSTIWKLTDYYDKYPDKKKEDPNLIKDFADIAHRLERLSRTEAPGINVSVR